jgi:hypothetical protein
MPPENVTGNLLMPRRMATVTRMGMEDNMYVYIQTEPRLWTVGFYDPDGKWIPESDHDSREKAAERVHYLNGK